MNRIKDLRTAKGLNQRELALAIDVAQPTLSGWEKGARQMDYDNLRKLSVYFNVSIDYILGYSDNPNPPNINEIPTQPLPYPKEIIKLAEQIQDLPLELRILVEQQLRVYAKLNADPDSSKPAD